MKKPEYPKQIKCAFSKKEGRKKTFSIDAELEAAQDYDVVNPLEIYEPWSRFRVTIIDDTESNKIYPFANIPINDLDYIVDNTRNARLANLIIKHLKAPNSKQQSNQKSSAYTEKIRIGDFKGKTPAAVLIENPDNLDKLKGSLAFLQTNITKHNSNKLQIAAIEEAIALFNNNDLKNEQVEDGPLFSIYNEPIKVLSKKDEKGRRLVYGIKISYDPSADSPFIVQIFNCFAPLGEDKLPDMSQKTDYKKAEFNITDKAWCNFVGKMERTRNEFEILHVKNAWTVANQFSYKPVAETPDEE